MEENCWSNYNASKRKGAETIMYKSIILKSFDSNPDVQKQNYDIERERDGVQA